MDKKICAVMAGIGIAFASVVPVQAVGYANGCSHKWEPFDYYEVCNWNSTQHQVGGVTKSSCKYCHAIQTEEPGWENHNMKTDGNSMIDHGNGLISYDEKCTVCGYEDSIYIQIP